jgi:hypothetical protein
VDTKIRVNVIIPGNMKNELRQRMLKDGYGLREKSIWISEAIESLIKLEDFPALVQMAGMVSNLSDVETVYITPRLKDSVEEALLNVRRNHPALEGVTSLIVRASIIRRLALISTPKNNPVTGQVHKPL